MANSADGCSILNFKLLARTAFLPANPSCGGPRQRERFLNGTLKKQRMDTHSLDAPIPFPDLDIGSSIRPATHATATPDVSPGSATQPPALRLLDRLRGEIRVRHYSIRTESAYVESVGGGSRWAVGPRAQACAARCCDADSLV